METRRVLPPRVNRAEVAQWSRDFQRRLRMLAVFAAACVVALFGRALYLGVEQSAFLQAQGELRHKRTLVLKATRGAILDRHGELLATSSPLASVWLDPYELAGRLEALTPIERLLARPMGSLADAVRRHRKQRFMYVARRIPPALGREIAALSVPGVYVGAESARFYPAAEVASAVVGLTNVDGHGVEGMELALDDQLRGRDGRRVVIRDLEGRVVDQLDSESAQRGSDVALTIDLRLQYAAHRALTARVAASGARWGTVAVLDVATGEVLAAAVVPSANPNARAQLTDGELRNRAVTDTFEPGSSIKPLVLAAALEAGAVTSDTVVDTSPGWIKIGPTTIRDPGPAGPMTLGQVLARSSNVAMARVALEMPAASLYEVLRGLGLGRATGSDFPGEVRGRLARSRTGPTAVTSLSRGYGVSVTAIQLAQAYAAIANGGALVPVRWVRDARPATARRVIEQRHARTVIGAMESVVAPDGTGRKAAIPGYRVAGKTGTAWSVVAGRYAPDRRTTVFAGVVPANSPRLACVVVLDQPRGAHAHGGDLAAPVFSQVVGHAVRLLGLPADGLTPEPSQDEP